MCQYKILNGLPAYGEPALSFPKPGSFREGFVVEFTPSEGQSWIGNFEAGYGTQDPEGRVWSGLGDNVCLVVVRGAIYLIDTRERVPLLEHREIISWSGFHHSTKTCIVCTNTRVLAYSKTGIVWESCRISWDGISDAAIDGDLLKGMAFNAMDDEWYPFEVDLTTGTAIGGAY